MRLIAIDGPAGSGKSTVAAALAERLGLSRLDTGAMYRSVALVALRRGIDIHDGERLAAAAEQMDLYVGAAIILDGEDVTEAIRTPEVDAIVSSVAAEPLVREQLVQRQRQWATVHRGGVVEGRDIASVVFPDATLKIFLTASEHERVRRAHERSALDQQAIRGDGETALGATRALMERRDRLDTARTSSPLVVADGAVTIDSTDRSVDEVVEQIVALL